MLHRYTSKKRAAAALGLAFVMFFCASAARAKSGHLKRSSRARTAARAAHASSPSGAYDVLYGWRPEQSAANALRYKVAHLLGPDMSKRLRVVRSGGRYAVVYSRHGSLASIENVVRSHTRMLASHGLPAPEAVKSQDLDSPAPAQTAQQAAQPAPQPVQAPAAGPSASGPKAAQAEPRAAAQPAAEVVPDNSTAFEAKVGQYLKHLRQTGSIKQDESTAWAIYDLTDNAKLAGINEDSLMQTASLVKPFVALAYFHEVKAGRQQYNPKAQRLMVEMIRNSDNAAADWFMRLLGGPAATQKLLKDNYGGLFRDLSLVEYIPRNGHTYLNKASVRDYTAFLHSLWADNMPYSDELKRVMQLPKRNRLSTGTPVIPRGTEVYDKTGTTSRLCGDMGIVVARRDDGKRFPYIVIGVIQKNSPASRYFSWMHNRGDVIRRISEMAYEEIAARHHFKDHYQLEAAARAAEGPVTAEAPAPGNAAAAPVVK